MQPNPTGVKGGAATRAAPAGTSPGMGKQLWNKVPEITLYFWIIKILCTTVGETIGDLLTSPDTGLGWDLGIAALAVGAVTALVLVVQFRLRKYQPATYWLAVVLISVVGTLITDKLHDDLGYDLGLLSIVFAAALAIVFGIWFSVEKSLSIRTIYTKRREGFYWAAILATFALGTAAGDWLLETFKTGLGGVTIPGNDTVDPSFVASHPREALLVSAALFGLVIVGAAVAHLKFKVNPVLAFWIAYVFTRPFGANIGDFFAGDPVADGGLGLSKLMISSIFVGLIIILVVYLTITKKDARPDPHFVVETAVEHAEHQPGTPPPAKAWDALPRTVLAPRRLECPKCQNIITWTPPATPVCSRCGYSGQNGKPT